MVEPRPVTATVDRRRLIEVLDIVADATDAVETLHGDPDLVRAVRYAIAEVASDLEAADVVGAIDTADDPVRDPPPPTLTTRTGPRRPTRTTPRRTGHLRRRRPRHLPPLRGTAPGPFRRQRLGPPPHRLPLHQKPPTGRPARLRRTVVRVAPDHEPVVRRSGGDFMVSLAQPDYQLAGVKLVVAVPLAAARRWAIRLCSEIGQSLAAAERGEDEYGESLNQSG